MPDCFENVQLRRKSAGLDADHAMLTTDPLSKGTTQRIEMMTDDIQFTFLILAAIHPLLNILLVSNLK